MQSIDRDLIGYGGHPPSFYWPEGARIAISFVINYEEGAEANILDGDNASECYLTDIPNLTALPHARHLSSESMFEYGSRAGIWRLINLFDHYHIPVTIFAAGLALVRNNDFADYLANSIHEVAGHGYRWINYREVKKSVERNHIKKTCQIINDMTHKEVYGWYTGRRSAHTRELIIEQNLLYDSDSYADDLPYWLTTAKRQHLIIPYGLDTNDAKYVTTPGWSCGTDFYNYLCASFDYLYQEGKTHPKMMSVGLHPRLSGRPGRSDALRQFIQYTQKHKQIWYCRRSDIAHHWYQHFKPSPRKTS